MKAGIERNGLKQIGMCQVFLKIILNRLCTVSNFHTITSVAPIIG